MNLNPIESKKNFIENKKKDLSFDFLKQSLGSLFIAVNDLTERVEGGLKYIEKLEDLDDIFEKKSKDSIMIDISGMEYNAELDKIAYAKRLNEDLCVIAKDIILEEYQIYLTNMYNIDALIFDVAHINPNELKNLIFVSQVMGIELIYSIESAEDFKKIENYADMIRYVIPKKEELIKLLPKNVMIVKDANSVIKDSDADLIIVEKGNIGE